MSTPVTRRKTHLLPDSTSQSLCYLRALSYSLTRQHGISPISLRRRVNSKMRSSRNCQQNPCERRQRRRRRLPLRMKPERHTAISFRFSCPHLLGTAELPARQIDDVKRQCRIKPCIMPPLYSNPKESTCTHARTCALIYRGLV